MSQSLVLVHGQFPSSPPRMCVRVVAMLIGWIDGREALPPDGRPLKHLDTRLCERVVGRWPYSPFGNKVPDQSEWLRITRGNHSLEHSFPMGNQKAMNGCRNRN